MKILLTIILLINLAYAWEGYSPDKGDSISIESYDHKGRGEGPVEYYDYSSGEYKSGYLDMYSGGTGTITDDDTGESFDVEMENN
jgi:hypothetical protein